MNLWPILLPITLVLAGFILYAGIAPYHWRRWREERRASKQRLLMRQAQQYWNAGDKESALWIVRKVLAGLGIPVAHLSDDELITGLGLVTEVSAVLAAVGVTAEEAAAAMWQLGAALQSTD